MYHLLQLDGDVFNACRSSSRGVQRTRKLHVTQSFAAVLIQPWMEETNRANNASKLSGENSLTCKDRECMKAA